MIFWIRRRGEIRSCDRSTHATACTNASSSWALYVTSNFDLVIGVIPTTYPTHLQPTCMSNIKLFFFTFCKYELWNLFPSHSWFSQVSLSFLIAVCTVRHSFIFPKLSTYSLLQCNIQEVLRWKITFCWLSISAGRLLETRNAYKTLVGKFLRKHILRNKLWGRWNWLRIVRSNELLY
jgi:hypothetical protein